MLFNRIKAMLDRIVALEAAVADLEDRVEVLEAV